VDALPLLSVVLLAGLTTAAVALGCVTLHATLTPWSLLPLESVTCTIRGFASIVPAVALWLFPLKICKDPGVFGVAVALNGPNSNVPAGWPKPPLKLLTLEGLNKEATPPTRMWKFMALEPGAVNMG
jgi:hypothetical protein